jgi:hypothetical protein
VLGTPTGGGKYLFLAVLAWDWELTDPRVSALRNRTRGCCCCCGCVLPLSTAYPLHFIVSAGPRNGCLVSWRDGRSGRPADDEFLLSRYVHLQFARWEMLPTRSLTYPSL